MSEKTIEAVAKALARADGFHPDAVSNDEDSVPAWTLYVEMARAAIKAYEAAKMAETNQPATEFLRDHEGRIVGTRIRQ